MNKISQKAIQTIQKENLKPLPKGFFIILNLAVFILTIGLLTLGAISISSFLYNTDISGFQLILNSKPKLNKIPFLIQQILPFTWVLILLVIGVLSSIVLRKSKLNYQIDFKKILVLFFIPQLLLGWLFLEISIPERIDNNFSKLGIKQNLKNRFEQKWFNPEQGLLVGEVDDEDNSYTLIDPSRNKWELIFSLDPEKLDDGDHIRLRGNIDLTDKTVEVINWQQIPKKFKKPR